MKCTHPDHEEGKSCKDRAVSCSKYCFCCMGELVESEPHQFKANNGECQYFLHCHNKATTTIPNPVLGPVPTCEKCKHWYDSLV